MLFQHIYNWIKYKTLPPSLLFKNRLFIERDSKFRRITNNLGLTFRNSKWTNLEMNNLHLKFLNSYFIVIGFFLTIFFIIFTYVFVQYYSSSTIFNNVAFIVWSGLDLIDYYITFIIWSTVIFLSIFIKGLYSYFFTSFGSGKKILVKEEYLKKFANENKYEITDAPILSKHDFKWIIFNWLLHSKSKVKDDYMEYFFQPAVVTESTKTLSLFFLNLFKLIDLITKFNSQHTPSNLTSFLIKTKYDYSNITTSHLLFQNPSWFSYLILKNSSYFKTSFNSFYFNYFFLNSHWNLNVKNTSIINDYNISPLFYLSNFKLSLLSNATWFKEYSMIYSNFINKSEILKTNRWLYRYSLTHRRNFKNSHKLTLTKKLIGTGLMDKNLSNKNIWNSEFIKKFSKNNTFHHLNNLLYSNYFKLNNLSHSLQDFNKNSPYYFQNLKNFSFYEHSFFWTFNRFKFNNNLINNSLTSNVVKFTQPFDLHSTKTTFQSQNIFLAQNLFFNQLEFLLPTIPFKPSFNVNNKTTSKDLFLILNNNEFFNYNDINSLLYLLKNSEITLESQTSLLYFSLLNVNCHSYKPAVFRTPSFQLLNPYYTSLDASNFNDINFWLFK